MTDSKNRQRRCTWCGAALPIRSSADGEPLPGRPRRYCGDRCRVAARRNRVPDELDFAAAVRDAIERSGHTLREIAGELARWGDLASGIATLSSWQSGASQPPRTQMGRNRVLALERCLDLSVGRLVLHLPDSPSLRPMRPVGQVAGQRRPNLDPLVERHRRLQDRVNTLTGSQQILPVSWSKEYVIGADRWPVRTMIRLRLRAAHDDVDRYWFLHAYQRRSAPTVRSVAGCELISELLDGESKRSGPSTVQVAAVELLFDRVLRRGEYYDFTFAVEYGRSPASALLAGQEFRHVQSQPCQQVDLGLVFDPHNPPLLVERCLWRGRDLQRTAHASMRRDGSRFELTLRNPVPGGYGWNWAWASAAEALNGRPGLESSAA